MNTNVTYIHHSCFAWEGRRTMVVYDFWRDTEWFKLRNLLAQTDKQVYFVVSHSHQDHFNYDILRWGRSLANPPRLLLSHDVVKRRHIAKRLSAVTTLRPDDHYEDELLKMDVYRSTDVGISSVITLKDEDGESCFHAGDLNNWYFPEGDERLHVQVSEMEGIYLATVREIQLDHPHITHAMFPLDPRLGKESLRGPSQWLTRIDTDHFYPMHTWGCHEETQQRVADLAYLFPKTQFHYYADPKAAELYGDYLATMEEELRKEKAETTQDPQLEN